MAVAGAVGRTPRVITLRVPAEFERCLGRPPLYRSGAFALHCARVAAVGDGADGAVDAKALPIWRLGLVIPKRYESSAVARNTIKRRWRAAFQRDQASLSAEFGSADLVVRLQGPLMPKSTAPATVAALAPAKLRARTLFDPQAMLTSLAARLRRGTETRTAPRVNPKPRSRPQATLS